MMRVTRLKIINNKNIFDKGIDIKKSNSYTTSANKISGIQRREKNPY